MRALALLALGACCHAAGASTATTMVEAPPDPISGTWVDADTGAFLAIGASGGRLVSIFVIDDDGEVWPVEIATWDGATLIFTTRVPSTGYEITRTLKLDGDTLSGAHEGSHSGPDRWRRMR
jgi:hypothetical protein